MKEMIFSPANVSAGHAVPVKPLNPDRAALTAAKKDFSWFSVEFSSDPGLFFTEENLLFNFTN